MAIKIEDLDAASRGLRSGIRRKSVSAGIRRRGLTPLNPTLIANARIYRADKDVYTDTGFTTAATNGQEVLGWKDQTASADHFTSAAGPTLVNGQFGKGARRLLDPTGQVDQVFICKNPTNALLNPTIFSVGMWVYVDATTTTDDDATLCGAWTDGTGTKRYSLRIKKNVDTNYYFEFHLSSGTTDDAYARCTTAVTFGAWHYVVGINIKNTTAADSLGISVDGAAIETGTGVVMYSNAAAKPFYIGSAVTTYGWAGRVAAAGIWNKALSEEDCAALYNSGVALYYDDMSAAQKADLIAFWDLNEPSTAMPMDRLSTVSVGALTDTLTDPADFTAVKQCNHLTWGFWGIGSAAGPNSAGFPALRFDGTNDSLISADLAAAFNGSIPEFTIGMVFRPKLNTWGGSPFSAGKVGPDQTSSMYWSTSDSFYIRDASGDVYNQIAWAGSTNTAIASTNGWDNPLDKDSGFVVTSATPSTLTKTSAGWTIDAYAGAKVYIVAGTGIGQNRIIISNTADTLTISTGATDWTVTPDNTSYYTFNDPPTHISGLRGAFQTAMVIGTHKTAAVYGHDLEWKDPNRALQGSTTYPILSKTVAIAGVATLSPTFDTFTLGAWRRGDAGTAYSFMNYAAMDVAMLVVIPKYLNSTEKSQLRAWMENEVGM